MTHEGSGDITKKGKLSPRYVGSDEIFQRIFKVAYELRLPNELALVHPIFNVSMNKKCIGNPESILPIECVCVEDNLSYEEVLAKKEVKELGGGF